MIFLSKWVICRFHVNLPGCNSSSICFLQNPQNEISHHAPMNRVFIETAEMKFSALATRRVSEFEANSPATATSNSPIG